MSNFEARSIIAAFAVFLLMPLAAYLGGVRPDFEVSDAQQPPVELHSLADSDYYSEWTKHLTANFALRDEAIRLNVSLDRDLLGSDSFDVLRGKDDWLFLPDSFTELCEAPVSPTEAVEFLKIRANEIIASGRGFRLVIPPDKAIIHRDRLIDGADTACADEANAELDAALAAIEIPGFTDIRPAIHAMSQTEPMFVETETHWTNRGAMVGINAMFPELFDDADVLVGDELSWAADLTRLAGVPREIELENLVIERPGVTVSQHPEDEVPRAFQMFSAQTTDAELLPGTTLVFHDSFLHRAAGDSITHSIAQFSEHTTFVSWAALRREDFDALIEASDRVVVEIVQRLVTNRLSGRFGANLSYEDWE